MAQTSAVYHPDDPHLRVINIAGRWQMQRLSGSEKATREHDPWYNVGLRMDRLPPWRAK